MIKDIYFGLKFSFSYFSIFPVKFSNNINLSKNTILSSMLFFFPLVGLFLSSFCVLLFQILPTELIYFNLSFCAILYMVLYGFIHTEAICDVSDAIYAKHSGKDPYKIIKEPTVGAMGVLYSTTFTILKIILIGYMFYYKLYIEFICISIISRMAMQNLFFTQTFKSSFLEQLKKSFGLKILILSFLFYSFLGYLFLSFNFIYLLIVGIIFSILTIKLLKMKLGFLNGDTIGTTLEIVEVVLFFIVLVQAI